MKTYVPLETISRGKMKTQNLWRWFIVFSLLSLTVLASAFTLAQGSPEGEASVSDKPLVVANWLHFGYDDSYTAHNSLENTLSITNVTQLERKWGIGCDDGWFSVIFRSPAIFNDTLYTSGAGSKLGAYDAKNGQKLWEFGAGNAAWAPQPIVSEDGVIFYMEKTFPTYLYAVEEQTGTQLWKAPIGFQLGYSGAAEAVVTVDEANDLVYIVEPPFVGGGKLFAMNKQTGEVAWYMGKQTHDAEFRGNYVMLKDEKIYAAAEVALDYYPFKGDKMLRIDPSSQDIEVAYDRPDPDNYYDIEQYTLCNDRLVASFDYQYDPVKLLAAYDPITSTIAWQKPFSTTITGKIACNTTKNQIYVPTDPYLYALDAATGGEVWKYMGYDEIYNPSIANGVVYFLSDTNMYALDEETGERLFHYPLGYDADETTQVAIADGMLYFSGNGGTCDLYALGLPGKKVFLPLIVQGG